MEPIKAVFTYGKATIHLEGPAAQIQTCLESGSVSKHLMSAAAGTKAEIDGLDDETFERAIEHSWEWFSLHADHRMRSVNFFIVSVAFLTAAYVTALRFAHPIAGVGVCIAGIFLTICFRGMEIRIAELIKASEAALKPLQAQLAKRTGIDGFKILEIVEPGKIPITRYSKVILALHGIALAMFAAGIWLAVYSYYNMPAALHL
jgi:hypothetical protein